MNDEKLVFTYHGTLVERPWPFTNLGRSLDELLLAKGVPLSHKTYDDCDEDFFLAREYESPSHLVEYCRTLKIPCVFDAVKKTERDYGSFIPQEVTWGHEEREQHSPFIPLDVLMEKLKHSQRGYEYIRLAAGDETRPGYDLEITQQWDAKGDRTLLVIEGNSYEINALNHFKSTLKLSDDAVGVIEFKGLPKKFNSELRPTACSDAEILALLSGALAL